VPKTLTTDSISDRLFCNETALRQRDALFNARKLARVHHLIQIHPNGCEVKSDVGDNCRANYQKGFVHFLALYKQRELPMVVIL